MKLQTLEYFIALAESRSINEAARRLYVAQPSLTKALQHLKKELGVQLFRREKTGITLTQAGEKILPEARQVVQYYKGWLALGKEAQSGTITVYSHISLSNFLLPDVLLDFKKRHPEVIVNHHAVLKPKEHLKDLSSPLLVLFICGQEEAREWADRYDCEYFTLFQGEYGCLVNGNSPLAQKETVQLADLVGKPLIVSRQMLKSSRLQEWFGENAGRLQVTGTYNLVYNGSLMVEDGMGYAICLDGIINVTGDSSLCFRPLEPSRQAGMYIVWKKYQIFSPAAERFLTVLRNMEAL